MEVETSSGMMEKVGKQEVGISLYVGVLLAVCVGVHIPQMAMPSLPDFSFSVPDLPDIELPEVPEITMPDLPEIKMPDLPEMKMPDLPEMKMPELPEISMPDLPEINVPSMPDVKIPDLLPDVDLPSIPEMPEINLNPSELAQKGYNKAMEGVYDMKDGLTETLHTVGQVVLEPLEKVWTTDNGLEVEHEDKSDNAESEDIAIEPATEEVTKESTEESENSEIDATQEEINDVTNNESAHIEDESE